MFIHVYHYNNNNNYIILTNSLKSQNTHVGVVACVCGNVMTTSDCSSVCGVSRTAERTGPNNTESLSPPGDVLSRKPDILR